MKFWNSISQALEDIEKSYVEWWNSLTVDDKQSFCYDCSNRWKL